MENKNQGILRINGSGSAGGGVFEKVIVNGSGHIKGDVKSDVINVNGSAHVDGNLDVVEVKLNGTAQVNGDIQAESLKLTGTARVIGAVQANQAVISGSTQIGGDLRCDSVRVDGSVKVDGSVSAETFTSNGGFDIGGLLTADEITVRMYGLKSHVKEIGGSKISVAIGPPNGIGVLKAIVSMGILNPILETETIEGDEVTLENTKASVVRGKTVTVGAGCDIGTVEYTESCGVSPDARVGTQTKV